MGSIDISSLYNDKRHLQGKWYCLGSTNDLNEAIKNPSGLSESFGMPRILIFGEFFGTDLKEKFRYSFFSLEYLEKINLNMIDLKGLKNLFSEDEKVVPISNFYPKPKKFSFIYKDVDEVILYDAEEKDLTFHLYARSNSFVYKDDEIDFLIKKNANKRLQKLEDSYSGNENVKGKWLFFDSCLESDENDYSLNMKTFLSNYNPLSPMFDILDFQTNGEVFVMKENDTLSITKNGIKMQEFDRNSTKMFYDEKAIYNPLLMAKHFYSVREILGKRFLFLKNDSDCDLDEIVHVYIFEE